MFQKDAADFQRHDMGCNAFVRPLDTAISDASSGDSTGKTESTTSGAPEIGAGAAFGAAQA
ncbi:MAG: hypothetical protein ACJAZO_001026 [Myxococcota bacterium]|jgi:hypothetical protein